MPEVYQADHLGSLLRPPELLQSRADLNEGQITTDNLREIEDNAILEALQIQCHVGIGIFAEFICVYHGWAYDSGGRLQGVPNLKDAYYKELDTQERSLMPVAQLDSYKGLLFATVDPHAPPLLEYLGEAARYLDMFFDRREGGVEVKQGMRKWVVSCNWKLPAENFAGDSYHVACSHLSAIKAGFVNSPST